MTVKAKDLPTNNLNINEIKQNTPPKITLGCFFVITEEPPLRYMIDTSISKGIPVGVKTI